MVLEKNAKKPPFLVSLGKEVQFWTVFGQNGQNGENYQKITWKFFLHLQALTKCKVSVKSNERFPTKSVAAEQNIRTGPNSKVSNDRL